jgi:hypothetical protein
VKGNNPDGDAMAFSKIDARTFETVTKKGGKTTVGIENPKFRSVGWRGGYCRRKRALENSANRLWRS